MPNILGHYNSAYSYPGVSNMATTTADDMPTIPDAFSGNFNLQDVEFIGHYSRIGHDGQQIAFDDSNIRYCIYPVNGTR